MQSELLRARLRGDAEHSRGGSAAGMTIRERRGPPGGGAADRRPRRRRRCIIKGGHSRPTTSWTCCTTVTRSSSFDAERVAGRHTHGTGCTFAAAIAAHLALGRALARRHSAGPALRGRRDPARARSRPGHGPMDHFWARPRPPMSRESASRSTVTRMLPLPLVAVTPSRSICASTAADRRGHGDGAIASFVGLVRDNNQGRRVSFLEYEAYEPLAVRALNRIVDEARTPGRTRGWRASPDRAPRDRRGQHHHRGRIAASRRCVRGVPLHDRARQADRADLEARALRGRRRLARGATADPEDEAARQRPSDRMRVTVRLFARLRDIAGPASWSATCRRRRRSTPSGRRWWARCRRWSSTSGRCRWR